MRHFYLMTSTLKRAVLSLFMLGLISSGYAQFYFPVHTKALNAKPNILLVEVDDFEYLAGLDSMIKKYWHFDGDVWFKTGQEIDQTISINRHMQFTVLSAGYRNEIKKVDGKEELRPVYCLSLYLSEDAGKRRSNKIRRDFIYKMNFPYAISSELEMKLFLHNACAAIDSSSRLVNKKTTPKKYAVDKQRILRLEQKTLLIPAEQTKLSSEEIKALYPHPFEIISSQEIQLQIMSGNTDFMAIDMIWSDKKTNWSLMLIDLGDYQVNMEVPARSFKPNVRDTEFEANQKLALEKSGYLLNDKFFKKLSSTVLKAKQSP